MAKQHVKFKQMTWNAAQRLTDGESFCQRCSKYIALLAPPLAAELTLVDTTNPATCYIVLYPDKSNADVPLRNCSLTPDKSYISGVNSAKFFNYTRH